MDEVEHGTLTGIYSGASSTRRAHFRAVTEQTHLNAN